MRQEDHEDHAEYFKYTGPSRLDKAIHTLEGIVHGISIDGAVSETELNALNGWIGAHLEFADRHPFNEVIPRTTCPEITFEDRSFCFTGSSERYNRRTLAGLIESLGGKFARGVVNDLDYLVIGGAGNPCWAYACYGRKVEQAVTLRKQGHSVLLVHEFDFFDAVEDA